MLSSSLAMLFGRVRRDPVAAALLGAVARGHHRRWPADFSAALFSHPLVQQSQQRRTHQRQAAAAASSSARLQRHDFYALLRTATATRPATSSAVRGRESPIDRLLLLDQRAQQQQVQHGAAVPRPSRALQSFLSWAWPQRRFAARPDAGQGEQAHVVAARRSDRGRADACFRYLVRQLRHVETHADHVRHRQEQQSTKDKRGAPASSSSSLAYSDAARLVTLCCGQLFFLLCNISALAAEISAAGRAFHSRRRRLESTARSVPVPLLRRSQRRPALLLSHPFHLLDGLDPRSTRNGADDDGNTAALRACSQSVLFVLPPEHSRFRGECVELGAAAVDPKRPTAIDAAYLVFDAPRAFFFVARREPEQPQQQMLTQKQQRGIDAAAVEQFLPFECEDDEEAKFLAAAAACEPPYPDQTAAIAAARQRAAAAEDDLWDDDTDTPGNDVIELFSGRTDFPLLLHRGRAADEDEDDSALMRGRSARSTASRVLRQHHDVVAAASAQHRQRQAAALRHNNNDGEDNAALLQAMDMQIADDESLHHSSPFAAAAAEVQAHVGRLPLLVGGPIRGEALLLHRCREVDFAARQLGLNGGAKGASLVGAAEALCFVLPVRSVLQSPVELGGRVVRNLDSNNCRVVIGRAAADFTSALSSAAGNALPPDRWWAFEPVSVGRAAGGNGDLLTQLLFGASSPTKEEAPSLAPGGPTGVVPVAATRSAEGTKASKKASKTTTTTTTAAVVTAPASSVEDGFAHLFAELDGLAAEKQIAEEREGPAAEQLRLFHASLWHRVIVNSGSSSSSNSRGGAATLVQHLPDSGELQRVVLEYSAPARFAEGVAALGHDETSWLGRDLQESDKGGRHRDSVAAASIFACDGYNSLLHAVQSQAKSGGKKPARKKMTVR